MIVSANFIAQSIVTGAGAIVGWEFQPKKIFFAT